MTSSTPQITSNAALKEEHKERDANFSKALHGTSVESPAGLRAMFGKSADAKKVAVDEYFKHWDNKTAKDETAEDRASRTADYASITQQYYNLATDLYEHAWGQSFHFSRFSPGEPLAQATARHEHYLAHQASIKPGTRVLDAGCGVGGPARQIAKFTGAHITGLNISDYQLARATRYAHAEGLSAQLDFAKGDFTRMDPDRFPDDTFDAAYAIEATVHAPSLQLAYAEIHRVLKPGAIFAVYEWLLTERYDPTNEHHRALRLGIEQGDGIASMPTVSDGLAAMRAAGFELLRHEDLAERGDPIPWYWPIAGEWRYMQSVFDVLTVARMTWWGRGLAHMATGVLERMGVAPRGTQKTADSLARAADCLVQAGREGLFTPMYLMVGRKPEMAAK